GHERDVARLALLDPARPDRDALAVGRLEDEAVGGVLDRQAGDDAAGVERDDQAAGGVADGGAGGGDRGERPGAAGAGAGGGEGGPARGPGPGGGGPAAAVFRPGGEEAVAAGVGVALAGDQPEEGGQGLAAPPLRRRQDAGGLFADAAVGVGAQDRRGLGLQV